MMNKTLFTIKEAADLLGVSTKTLRRWEARGLLIPSRTQGNQRRYTLDQIEVLQGKEQATSDIPNNESYETPHVQFEDQAHNLPVAFERIGHIQKISLAGLVCLLTIGVTAMLLGTATGGMVQEAVSLLTKTVGLEDIIHIPPTSNEIAFEASGAVLSHKTPIDLRFNFGIPVRMLEDLTVEAPATFSASITAPNILYDLVAGSNITISEGQTPTVGLTNNVTLTGGLTLGNVLNLGQLASDPTTAVNGANYYNTASNKLRCYQNGSWKDCDTDTDTTGSGDITAVSVGNGLSGGGSSGDVTISLDVTTTSTTTTTSANSGLELTSAGLSLLRGCSDNQVLQWDSTNSLWECVSAGTGGIGDITAVGSMTSGDVFADSTADDDWLGLGASAGRIEFDDQTIDEINFLSANIGIGDSSPDNVLDINSTTTSGNIVTVGAESAVTLAGTLTGQSIDLSTNYTSTNQEQTGLDILLDGQTNTHTSGTKFYKGIEISGTALEQNGAGGTTNYSGIEITLPAITQTAGTVTAQGISIIAGSSGGDITTGGTHNAIGISARGVTAGALNGINFGNLTAPSTGTETAINIGASWDTDINATTTLEIGIGGTNEVVLSATNFYPATAEGNSLGSSSAEWEQLFLGDNAGVNFGLDDDFTLAYDELTDDRLELTPAAGTGVFFIDGGTTDRTADLVSLDVDVNSAAVDGIFIDLDIGTALSSGEIANGINIDVAGLAGDDSAAFINGIYLVGNTTSGATVTAIDIETTFDIDISLQNDETISNTSDGTIAFGVGGSAEVNLTATAVSPATAEGNSLGGSSAEWEQLFLGDNAGINFGLDDDFTLAYDELTDDRLELTATNKEFAISLGTQDVNIVGSAEGTAALTLTAGDLVVTDGDVTVSSGETSLTSNSNTVNTLSVTNNTITTLGVGVNTAGMVDISSTSLSTGNLVNLETTTALSTGRILNVSSTSTALTTGNLVRLEWLPGSSTTATTADLFQINLGSNGTLASGNLFNILDSSSSIFSVSETAMTTSLPSNFTAPGDVSIAYDINFTNQTASYIKSSGPFYLEAGESFESNDLGLIVYNAGSVVIDGSSDVNTGTTGVLDLNVNTATSGNIGFNIDYTIDSGAGAANNHYAAYINVLQNDTDADAFGLWIENDATAVTIAGTNLVDCLLCLNNNEAQAGAVLSAILIDGDQSTAGAITNGINIDTTDVTTDIILQNGETIDNNTNGQINLNTGTAATGDGIYIDSGATTSTAFGLCHSGADADNAVFADRQILACSGTVDGDFAEQYPVAAGIDYGDIVVLGTKEVITNKGHKIVQLVKSTAPYQETLVGVVSNNYSDFTTAGYDLPQSENPMPVALVGRVPVKVSSENGPIKKGDYLTTSSTAGVAMKATRYGPVVGMALEDFSGTVGQVMIFVKATQADPNDILANLHIDRYGNVSIPITNNPSLSSRITILDEQGSSTISLGNEGGKLVIKNATGVPTIAFDPTTGSAIFTGEVFANVLHANRIEGIDFASLLSSSSAQPQQQATQSGSQTEQLLARFEQLTSKLLTDATPSADLGLDRTDVKIDEITVVNQFTSVGQTFLANTNIAGTLTVGTMMFDDLADSINTIGTLKLQDDPLSGALEVFGTIKLARDGTIETQGSLVAKEVQTGELTISIPPQATPSGQIGGIATGSAQLSDRTIGEGIIKLGQTKTIIETTRVKADSKIFITPTTSIAQPLVVAAKKEGVSFTVSMTKPTDQTITFDWWIVNTKPLSYEN